MRDRTAHGGGIIFCGDLDARLVERSKIRDRRARLDDVGRVGNLIDRAERHLGNPHCVLRQERYVPDALRRRVGDLSGMSYATYSTGTPSWAAISLPSSTGTPA